MVATMRVKSRAVVQSLPERGVLLRVEERVWVETWTWLVTGKEGVVMGKRLEGVGSFCSFGAAVGDVKGVAGGGGGGAEGKRRLWILSLERRPRQRFW